MNKNDLINKKRNREKIENKSSINEKITKNSISVSNENNSLPKKLFFKVEKPIGVLKNNNIKSEEKNNNKNKTNNNTSENNKIVNFIYDDKNQIIEREKEKDKKENNNKENDNISKNKDIEEEYDIIQLEHYDYISNIINDFIKLNEEYSFYTYNNCRELYNNKELLDHINKAINSKENKEILEDFAKFYKNRDKIYRQILNEDNSNKKLITRQKECSSNSTVSSDNDINASTEYKNLPIEKQYEIFFAVLIGQTFSKINNEINNFDTRETTKDETMEELNDNNNNKNKLREIKIEVQNFGLNDASMLVLLNGIKFKKNLSSINLSGNPLSKYSCMCLGNVFKYHNNIKLLNLMRCSLNNICLYYFIKGATFIEEIKNKEQINLDHLNLKDNNLNSEINNLKEHPISSILEKFKIMNLNLANNKLGNKTLCDIFKKIIELIKNNKDNKEQDNIPIEKKEPNKPQIALETLNLYNTDIKNEECLKYLGDIISNEKFPLKTLILSKNLITSYNSEKDNKENYFEYFIQKLKSSKITDLLLLKCEIGKNINDVNNIINMLKENKHITSLRMFDNEINNFEKFVDILSLFSSYGKDKADNTIVKSLDLSKNKVEIIVTEKFLKIIENLNLEYLDINQNHFVSESDKDKFRTKTNAMEKIKIVY